MQGYDAGVGEEVIQRAEAVRALSRGPGRVVEQQLETELAGHLLHFFADMADADDPERDAVETDGFAGSDAV